MFEIGNILTLEDNLKYIIISKAIIYNATYLYLLENDDYTNPMFCKIIGDKLEEVTDTDFANKLLNFFAVKLLNDEQ